MYSYAQVFSSVSGVIDNMHGEIHVLGHRSRAEKCVMQGETATNVHQKCDELKEQLNESKTALHDKDRTIDGVKAEYDQLRDKISIMDERIVARDKCASQQDLSACVLCDCQVESEFGWVFY